MKSSPLVRQASSEKESTKSENLTEYLIEAIVEGELAPGSKISEPELAKQFQVSRGPLREALMRVEGLGLIERIPHIGARVIQLSPTKLVELYAVREALEGMAARLAARNITEIELAGLESLLSTHSTHIDQVEGASYFHQQGDFDFHYRIIQASRNQQLIGLLCDELYHLLRMYRYQSPRSHSRPVEALEEHKFILRAIRQRDEELAEMLMRRHISRSRQLIEQQIMLDAQQQG
ncbi:GntR family transcriptional regulator [Vibrio cholerae]|uniref:GntR family transcriptional regulator n=1 Tax=Vibrio cholerae TaxID=666 RepID=UPI00166826FF|nr:GntR family transcriptional regulator [Vibrio cholerae]GFK33726.1 putative D-xylose utilization operon transcriptional repressor [Vibrio cholerae]GFK37320.1 putative D-xylose utilization operon transcriptional repressor [Vibrio cholerae]GFK40775.1 putative D-xylose utilization operon transcriptional repressor [Vibrio cholerae]GFK44360.1 putative D-xylose utilization operon transcriptional repressor [Vibrio cholerae]GFK47637.1 putative D-xylose utilization operon transcriptional repressor [V